jgi:hypothetical protein
MSQVDAILRAMPDETVLQALDLLRTTSGMDRCQVLWQLDDHGSNVIETLRHIRRHGPGRLRRAALEALVYAGGEAAVDRADLTAVERLIRIKQPHEAPQGIDACWNHWICVSGGDQPAIMATLGLTAYRPATFALAASVIEGAGHGDDPGLVFVSPQIGDWTAVIGPWCDPIDDDRHDEVRILVERLSAIFGEAHAFYFGSQNDGSAWLIAREGRTIRRYSELSADMAIGEPLPVEREFLDRVGLSGKPEDYHYTSDDTLEWALWDFHSECSAREVAGALSIDTVWGMPTDVTVRGRGLLARVPGAADIPIPPGPHHI